MRNRNLIIGLVIAAVVLIGAGIFVLSSNRKSAPVQVAQVASEDVVSIMKPEDIGLSLTAAANGKELILEVADTEGISSLDYELSYTSKGDIPRGVIGHIDVKVAGKPVIQEITLGTCSDVCHYDEDVANINLILKVAKTDGSTSQIEKSLEI